MLDDSIGLPSGRPGYGPIRVGLIADGPVDSVHTNSGVAAGLSAALSRRNDIEIGVAANGVLNLPQRLLARLMTFRIGRRNWDRNYLQGLTRQRLRSFVRDRRVGFKKNRLDILIHVRNVYFPPKYPYAAFVDSVYALSQREWPAGAYHRRFVDRRLRFEKRYLGGAQIVFTAGQLAADEIVTNYGVDVSKVVVVGAGLNFERRPAQSSTGWEGKKKNILFVGKQFDRKGGPDLLAAFATVRRHFPDAELHLVGCAVDVAMPGVIVHGLVHDRARMAELYSAASVFCLPAIFEPFGLVVVEAMAYSLPCVVTRVGVLADLVADGENGLVVAPSNAEELSAALCAILGDAKLSAEMGRLSFERSVEMTWDNVAERMVRAMHTLR